MKKSFILENLTLSKQILMYCNLYLKPKKKKKQNKDKKYFEKKNSSSRSFWAINEIYFQVSLPYQFSQ